MPYSGAGVFAVYTPGTPYVTGTVISSSVANLVNGDFATGLSTAICKDGQTTITANLPMAGFKHTGLGAGSGNGDSVRYEQVGALASAQITTLSGAVINTKRGSIVMHETTMDIWAQPNIMDGTGSAVTLTAITNAPQAGACRTVYPPAGTVITNGATFDVDGGANYTTAAGDALEFEAVTTSTYKVHITKADGTSVVGFSSGTAVASTSGTSIDFTGIPAGTKRVSINFSGVSLNNTSSLMVQIGDSGGIETSGYNGAQSSSGSTSIATTPLSSFSNAGFVIYNNEGASLACQGRVVLELLDAAAFTWTCSGVLAAISANVFSVAGVKSLSAALDRVRITTTVGTAAFDAGAVNITYEQ